MNAIENITIGHTERLRKPVGYTMLANLVNIVPFCLSIEAINVIFRAFDGSGMPLDTQRLWTIFILLVVYVFVMALAERASYRANFRGAYEMSAAGRISLAEHLRKLSLGFLSRRDPGDLSSMLITDFTMAETGISHHLPQLMGDACTCLPRLAMDRLANGRCHVYSPATCRRNIAGQYLPAIQTERQTDCRQNQCRQSPGRVLAGNTGNESI